MSHPAPFSEGAFSWEVGRAVKLALSRKAVGFKSRSISVRGSLVTREPSLDYLGCGPEECLIIAATIGAVSRETLVLRSLLADIRDDMDAERKARRWRNQVEWVSLTVLAGLCRAMFDEKVKAERALQNARAS